MKRTLVLIWIYIIGCQQPKQATETPMALTYTTYVSSSTFAAYQAAQKTITDSLQMQITSTNSKYKLITDSLNARIAVLQKTSTIYLPPYASIDSANNLKFQFADYNVNGIMPGWLVKNMYDKMTQTSWDLDTLKIWKANYIITHP